MKIQMKYLVAISIVALTGAIFFWQLGKVINSEKQQIINDESVEYSPNHQIQPTLDVNEESSKGPLGWKIRYVNSALQIKLPERKPDFPEPSIGDESYKLKDNFDSFVLHPESSKNPVYFSYVSSIGYADYSENQIRFQSVFYVYKAKVDLKNKSLIDWISQSQRNMWNSDFPISDLPDLQARNRELKSPTGTELVYFHVPEPSDNGWYAYKSGDMVYLFSLGNSSVAVKGNKEGLWDEMMETLQPYEVPMNQPRNINNLKPVNGKLDMVWYPVAELDIEIQVRKDIAKEVVYQVEKLQLDRGSILNAGFTTKRLLEIGRRQYGKLIESNGYYVCSIGFFTRYAMTEKEYVDFLNETWGDDDSADFTPKSIDGYFVRHASPQSGCSQEPSDTEYEEKVITNWWGTPTSEFTENTNFDEVLRESVRRIK